MRKVWMHWQNLTDEQRIGCPTGSILRHGRAWLHLWQATVGWSWMFGGWQFRLGVTVNCHDDDMSFSFGIPGMSLHFGFEGVFPRRWKSHDLGRHCGVTIHGGCLWVDVWRDQNGWSRDMPWYAKGLCFDPADFLLGRRAYSERTMDGTTAVIAMPEGNYPVTIRLYEATWKRPRWPFPLRLIKAEVKSEKGIPVPGKGESEWDCGEDAVFSSTFPAGHMREAIAKFTEGILRDRGRHGSINWKPADKVEESK